MSMLNDKEIKKMIEKEKLIEGYMNLDTQVTQNGFDVTIQSIQKHTSKGAVDFSNNERVLTEVEDIEPLKQNADDKYGWWDLAPGVYKIRTNEVFNMPKNLVAIGQTRSTLLRNGVSISSGVVDAGFSGRLEFLLNVLNPHGAKLKQNFRAHQWMFFRISEVAKGYDGQYHGTE